MQRWRKGALLIRGVESEFWILGLTEILGKSGTRFTELCTSNLVFGQTYRAVKGLLIGLYFKILQSYICNRLVISLEHCIFQPQASLKIVFLIWVTDVVQKVDYIQK